MTGFVARGITKGSTFTASVQGNQFALLGFSATVSTFQLHEALIGKERS